MHDNRQFIAQEELNREDAKARGFAKGLLY
jgi:hypothetical protein